MPILVLFLFLELFLMVMAAIEHGWSVFWFELATAGLGFLLIRHNQEITVREVVRQATGQARMDLGFALLKSARITVGGMLLILPGFLTDILGAALLILPGLRSFLLRQLRRPEPPPPPPKPPRPGRSGRVVDGEVEPPRRAAPGRDD